MIDLYTFPTPNGFKVSIALEETGLPYTTHVVHLGKGEQFKPEFLSINPNNKIPAIVDQEGPDGRPLALFESGAILIYLAEKSGQLLPKDARGRYAALQWLMFQMGGVGPMFGQFEHFSRAKEKIPYAIDRYFNESLRILGVLEKRLTEATYLAGDEYSIADIATFHWTKVALKRMRDDAHFAEKLPSLPSIDRWLATLDARPAVQRGLAVPKLH